MLSLQKFREEHGLGNIQPTTNVTGPETELLNDLANLLRKNADRFRHIFRVCIDKMNMSTDEKDDVKRLISIVSRLKENPSEKKQRTRDPLDNVVVRPMGGGNDSGDSSGE